MIATKQTDIAFYERALEYLLDMLPDGLDADMLEALYLKPDNTRYRTLDEIFDRMIASAQNRQSMPKVIGYWDKNRDAILSVIGAPDVIQVANMQYDTLYEQLYKQVGFRYSESKNSLWRIWSTAVIDCARFLAPFGDGEGFYSFADELAKSESVSDGAKPYLRLALPMMIQQKVHGMGFALACDFLKELGYDCYPKPDVHLREVFEALNLSASSGEYDVHEAIVRVAQSVGKTPYRVDKIVYLICSGDFYADERPNGTWEGRSVGSHKAQFLEWYKSGRAE